MEIKSYYIKQTFHQSWKMPEVNFNDQEEPTWC